MTGTAMKVQGPFGTFTPFESMFDREPVAFRNRIARFFQEPFTTYFNEPLRTEWPQTVGWNPSFEIVESETEFILNAELPGLTIEDLKIEFLDGMLTIKGEKQYWVKDVKDYKYYLSERNYGAFLRSFTFPLSVDSEKITADFFNGVLTVHIPKIFEPKAKSRFIEINTTKVNGNN